MGYYRYKGKVPEATIADYRAYNDVKSTGVIGVIRIPPRNIEISTLKFNDDHAKNHGCTLENALDYIKNAKCSISRNRWDGQHTQYFSYEGATYVADETNTIKTAFSKKDFDIITKAIMEVFE